MKPTININIRGTVPLVAPQDLIDQLPMTERSNRTVVESRDIIKRIIAGEDRRILAIVGPCSIHDRAAGMEYARKLRDLAQRVSQRIFVVMRVYFEKPRTTVGWKGLINDPHLDGSFDIAAGLQSGRGILLEVAELGLPAATEMLEPITPQYIADLVSLASIGARTTESPTHRQMASGLSMPVGYKNGTDGNLQVALDAMIAARTPHSFLGIDGDGRTCIVKTSGNPWGHLIVRGGRSGPNFSPESLKDASAKLAALGLSPRVVVDCSHGNSNKDYKTQGVVWRNVIDQRLAGNDAIIGLMLESNLKPGQQKLGEDPNSLQRGVSITDACIGWDETEELILSTYEKLPALNAAVIHGAAT
jgi:3-deoxy-7-phosphoheptulonate synthase